MCLSRKRLHDEVCCQQDRMGIFCTELTWEGEASKTYFVTAHVQPVLIAFGTKSRLADKTNNDKINVCNNNTVIESDRTLNKIRISWL